MTATKSNQSGPPEADTFVNEAALLECVPISRRTAFTWRQEGLLPSVQIGGRILYHLPSVREALLRRQKGGAA